MDFVGILKEYWLREYYTVLILIMEVFFTRILHSFETDYSKRCMSCSFIGMGLITYYIDLVMILVTGMLYGFAIIIKTIIVVAGLLGIL